MTEASTSTLPESIPGLYVASDDVDDQPSRSYIPDLAPIRASEKKRLDFRGKLYLAPLTTTGNLPFRRLCGDFGNDISCSEMGLAQEFLNGNASEWSLVRRYDPFDTLILGSAALTIIMCDADIRARKYSEYKCVVVDLKSSSQLLRLVRILPSSTCFDWSSLT